MDFEKSILLCLVVLHGLIKVQTNKVSLYSFLCFISIFFCFLPLFSPLSVQYCLTKDETLMVNLRNWVTAAANNGIQQETRSLSDPLSVFLPLYSLPNKYGSKLKVGLGNEGKLLPILDFLPD